ncbi:MAG TPA: hypothetical protein VLM37_05460, partial [Fibrobacteraceae bacterium]|nr:hypothetical protein [Fibrobacteraceae bacterium]
EEHSSRGIRIYVREIEGSGSAGWLYPPTLLGYTMAHEFGHYAYGLVDEYWKYYSSKCESSLSTKHIRSHTTWPTLMANYGLAGPWDLNFSDSTVYDTLWNGETRPFLCFEDTLKEACSDTGVTQVFRHPGDQDYAGYNTWEWLTTKNLVGGSYTCPQDTNLKTSLQSRTLFYSELAYFRNQWIGRLQADSVDRKLFHFHDDEITYDTVDAPSDMYPELTSIYKDHALDYLDIRWMEKAPGTRRIYIVDLSHDGNKKGLWADSNTQNALMLARLMTLGDHRDSSDQDSCEIGLLYALGDTLQQGIQGLHSCHGNADAVGKYLGNFSKKLVVGSQDSVTEIPGLALLRTLRKAREWALRDTSFLTEVVLLSRGLDSSVPDTVHDSINGVLWDFDSFGVALQAIAVGDSVADRFSFLQGEYGTRRFGTSITSAEQSILHTDSVLRATACSEGKACHEGFETMAADMQRMAGGGFYYQMDSLGGLLPGVAPSERSFHSFRNGASALSIGTYCRKINGHSQRSGYGNVSDVDVWVLIYSRDPAFLDSSADTAWSVHFYQGDSVKIPVSCDTVVSYNQRAFWCQVKEKSVLVYDSVVVENNGLSQLGWLVIPRIHLTPPSFVESTELPVAIASSEGSAGTYSKPMSRISSGSSVILSYNSTDTTLGDSVAAIIQGPGGNAVDTVVLDKIGDHQWQARWAGYTLKGWHSAVLYQGDSATAEASFLVDSVPSDDFGPCSSPTSVDTLGWVHGRATPGDEDCLEFQVADYEGNALLRLADGVGARPRMRVSLGNGSWSLPDSLPHYVARAGYEVYILSQAQVRAGFRVQLVDTASEPTNWAVGLGKASSADRAIQRAIIQSADQASASGTYTQLALRLENTSPDTLRDFRLRWYFSTEYGLTPVVEDWWSADCSVNLVHLGGSLYAVELDYAGIALAPGDSLPYDPGSSIGVHYPNWVSLDKTNDWSWLSGTSFRNNPRVVLFDSANKVLQGTLPPDSLAEDIGRVDSVRVMTADDKYYDTQWTSPRLRLVNLGDSLSGFVLKYFFHEDSALATPLLWQGAFNLVLDSLGNGDWCLLLTYTGNGVAPQDSVEALVGLRRADWGEWDRTDDPSKAVTQEMIENERVEVYNATGVRIYGNAEVEE